MLCNQVASVAASWPPKPKHCPNKPTWKMTDPINGQGHSQPLSPPPTTSFSPFLTTSMSGYSSIFSSGLLATPRPNTFSDYMDSSTPPQSYGPLNVDSDTDTTPTKLNALPTPSSEEVMEYFMPRSRASSNASVTSSVINGAPRLRRRRSSLSIAANGLGAVKSPQRNAGIALQRSALMGTGLRPRSGSTDVGPTGVPRANEESYVSAPSRAAGGRSRSGSTGGTMR